MCRTTAASVIKKRGGINHKNGILWCLWPQYSRSPFFWKLLRCTSHPFRGVVTHRYFGKISDATELNLFVTNVRSWLGQEQWHKLLRTT